MVWPINEANLAGVRHVMGETKASQFTAGKANVAPRQEKLPRKKLLFHLGVFGFGSDEDGNVGIGVFP